MKRIMTVLGLSLLLVGWSPTADAAPGWFTTTVTKTGAEFSGQALVQLENASFGRIWFRMPALVAKEMLALTISAMVANLPVLVFVDPDAPQISDIKAMYLKGS